MHSDPRIIVDVVTAVDRRLRRQEQARFLTRLFIWSLAFPAILTFASLFGPVPVWAMVSLLTVWVVLMGSAAIWIWSRRRPLARAGSEIDRRASLHNELTSALWFVEQGAAVESGFSRTTSPWIEWHVARAARRAAALDTDALFPWTWPREVRTAGALAAILLVVNTLLAIDLVPRSWTRSWLQAHLSSTKAMTDAQKKKAREIQDLLEHVDQIDPSILTPEDRQLSREFADLLRDLEKEALTSPEARERLERIRKALEALAAMEQTKTPLDARGRPIERKDLQDLEDALKRALADAKAGNRPERETPGERSATDRLRSEARAEMRDATVRRLRELEESMSGRSRASNERPERGAEGQNQNAAEQGASQEGAQSNAQAPGQGQMQPMSGDGQQQGLQARGSLGGQSTDASMLVGPKTSLQVRLRRELLSSHTPGEPVEREMERPKEDRRAQETKQGRSTVPFQPVTATPRYARPDVVDPGQVPWPYRDLVKAYFQKIGPRGKGSEARP